MIAFTETQNLNFNSRGQNMSKQPNSHCYFRNNNESDNQQRVRNFRVSIRNRQLNQYKQRIRTQMLSIEALQQMVQNMPTDSQNTWYWAYEFAQKYAQTAKYILTNDQVVELFRFVEKFPNQKTLKLLQIIIYKSNIQAIDVMFQYDVIGLLHGFLNYSFKASNKSQNHQQISRESQEIIQQIVVIDEAIKKVQKNSFFYHQDQNYQEQVQMVRTVLRILGELCRKKQHIRNFSILNHKSFTYCLKSYKSFNKDIQIQFIAFLQSVTFYDFKRNEEQFDRITNQICKIFMNQIIQLKIEIVQQKTDRNYLISYEYLIGAMTNLLKMECAWTINKIFGFLDDNGQLKILKIILNLVNQCNYVFQYPTIASFKEQLLPNKLINLVVQLFMHVTEALDKMQITTPLIIDQIIFGLVQFLKKSSKNKNSTNLMIARRGIFFILSNYFFSNHSQNLISNLFIFDNQSEDNLIKLIARFLQIEEDYHNRNQILLVIQSIFKNIRLCTIENMLVSSELLSIIVEKMTHQENYQRPDNDNELSQKFKYLQLIVLFFQQSERQDQQKFFYYRQMMLSASRHKFQQIINHPQLNYDFGCKLCHFVEYLRMGCANN